jgi:hypothetical protein
MKGVKIWVERNEGWKEQTRGKEQRAECKGIPVGKDNMTRR